MVGVFSHLVVPVKRLGNLYDSKCLDMTLAHDQLSLMLCHLTVEEAEP